MPKCFVAAPSTGMPGTWKEPDGSEVRGIYTMKVEVYEPGEAVPAQLPTLATLRQKFWDEGMQALVIPAGEGAFVIGGPILDGVSESAMVNCPITFKHRAEGKM